MGHLGLPFRRRNRIKAMAATFVLGAASLGLAAGGALAAPSTAARAARPGAQAAHQLAANLVPLGPADPSQRLQLTVAVQGADPAGLQAAYDAIYTPGSASFHRYLTPAEITARFGAPVERWNAVAAWLAAGGLHLSYASPSRDVFLVEGTAAQVQQRFGVVLERYRNGAGVEFVANAAAPVVPPALGITGVLGLNTFDRAVPVARHGNPLAGATSASRTLSAVLGQNIDTQSPQTLWKVYDQPATAEGQGQALAVFGNGSVDTVVTDLQQFITANHLPRQVPVDVVHVGSGPFTDTSGTPEWNIDTQAAVGMAPQADHLTLYFGSDLTDANIAAIFSAWEADPAAPLQANASFGECEQNPVGMALDNPVVSQLANVSLPVGTGLVNTLQPVADPILLKATLQGKTLFAATGDTGSSCPVVAVPVVGAGNGVVNQAVPFLNYPASSPYVTAVGGTVLYTDGTGASASRAQEYAWTFGGGGASLFAAAPAYQQGVTNLNHNCLMSASGTPSPPGVLCRGVPDVAALSGDALGNGYPIVSAGQPSVGAGTSLSSPLWMGMWARLQGTSAAGGYGFANELLYRAGKNPTTGARDFTDITTGLLGIPGLGNGVYFTAPGWDYVTGWGVPDLANLIADAPALG